MLCLEQDTAGEAWEDEIDSVQMMIVREQWEGFDSFDSQQPKMNNKLVWQLEQEKAGETRETTR